MLLAESDSLRPFLSGTLLSFLWFTAELAWPPEDQLAYGLHDDPGRTE